MHKVGDKVGAVLKANAEEVVFFGYGTYVGDEVPPEDVGGVNFGIPNPKIELNEGGYVFGCECWWGSVIQIQEMLKGRKTIMIDLHAHRKAIVEANNGAKG